MIHRNNTENTEVKQNVLDESKLSHRCNIFFTKFLF